MKYKKDFEVQRFIITSPEKEYFILDGGFGMTDHFSFATKRDLDKFRNNLSDFFEKYYYDSIVDVLTLKEYKNSINYDLANEKVEYEV